MKEEINIAKGPLDRPYQVTISLTQAQTAAIHKIRTDEFHDLVKFATLVASLVQEALLDRQRRAEAEERKGI